MIRRARLISVVAVLLAGATGVIAATQTWLTVVLSDGAAEPLAVPGSAAVPVLAPLSLAVLALGAALSIVGRALRYIFAVIGLLAAVVLAGAAGAVAVAPGVNAVSATVTAATGIAGAKGVSDLVAAIGVTAWPAVTVLAQVVLAGAGILVLVTASRWGGGAGRRYRSAGSAEVASSRPHDAIDSWDDLSRGEDPTG